jgi:hypothetical protein
MKREEAIALRDQHKPLSLFRYRPLDKEREFENIQHQLVWLSQPAAANDPYDSSFTLSHAQFVWPEQAQAENVARFAPLAQDKLEPSEIAEFASLPDLPDERAKSLLQKAMPDIDPNEVDRILRVTRKVFGQFRNQHIRELNELTKRNLSICCFSETRDSMLMWTHYADQHRGCCLEFDVRHLFLSGGVGPLLPVLYTDERFDVTAYYSAIAAGGGNNWSALFASCRKTKDWSYEKEWRLVFLFPYTGEPAKFGMPLKSITIGLRTPQDHRRRLTEIAQKLNIPLYQTFSSTTNSELLFEPV